MKAFSRFHTPGLTGADRRKIARALGLHLLPLRLEESCGGIVLRRWDSAEGVTWEKSGSAAAELDFATLGPQMPVASARPSDELWRDLLPYPLCAVPNQDPAAAALNAAWAETEAEMADAELTLVWVGTPDEGIPLLLHYVRRRCIRLGTSQNLKEIALGVLSGGKGRDGLGSFFGTRTHFLHWAPVELSGRPEVHPLEGLASVLQAGRGPSAPPPGKPVASAPRSW